MTNPKTQTGYNADVAPTDEQFIERDTNRAPAPEGTATVRPWTADFLLPSIRFREPSPTEKRAH